MIDPVSPPATALQRLRPDQRAAALGTVVDAFSADSLLRWVWPDEGRYAACAPGFFGMLLDLRRGFGECWVAGECESVAMWDPPGGLYAREQHPDWAPLQAMFTAPERDAWATYDDRMAVPAEAGVHWYLGVLATATASRGRGLARLVLSPMLAAADRTGLPCYLETASPTNVGIYGRLGFETVFSATMPDNGRGVCPEVWLMRRDPR